MAAGKRYSAGRIFLQVLPAFGNLQKLIEREVGKANRSAENEAEESGRRGGERRAKAEGKAVVSGAKKTQAEVTAAEKTEDAKRQRGRLARERKTARGVVIITRDKVKDQINAEAAGEEAHKKSLDRMSLREQKNARGVRKVTRESVRERIEGAAKVAAAEIAASNAAAAGYAKSKDRLHQAKNRSIAAQRLEGMRENDSLQGGALGQAIRSSTRRAANALPDNKITVDSSEAERKIAGIRAQLLSLSDAKIGVDISAAGAIQTLAFLRSQLNRLEKDDANIDVNANVAGALLALKAVERQVDQIQRKKLRGMFLGMFAGLKPSAEDGANSFRIFNMRVLGLLLILPLLAPALMSAAAAIGALAVAGTAAAAGIGVTILAFSGIKDAVTAMSQVSENAKKDTLARVKSLRTASKGIRDAQQGVARADQQATRAAQDSSRRISDAQAAVIRARRDAGRAAEDSSRRIADAERRLAEAQESAADSQDRLREARKRAQQDQLDLADQIKRGILDERQALIDLFNAQVDYNAVMASGGSTNLEKEQSDINLQRAQLAIKEIRDSNKELATENATAAAKGIEGSAAVVGAKKDERDASQAIADAERGLADARRDATQQAMDSAENIADAERSVADARREAAQQAQDSAIAQRDAQERLTDAQAAYGEALADSSESVDKLRIAMDKLSPAGQRFALFIFSLRNGVARLKEIASTNILPGLQEAMEGVIDRYGPGFFAFVDKMSKVAGGLFTALGEAFKSPVMAAFFETMAQYGPTLFKLFGEIGINVIKIFGGIMTAFAPFSVDFMGGLEKMTAAWAKWAEGLKENPAFIKFIEDVKRDGPKLLKLIWLVGSTVWTVLKGLSEGGVLDKITGFFQFLKDLDPAILTGIVGALVGMLIATQVASGITSLFIAFKIMTMTLTGSVVLALFLIVGGLVLLYKNSETFRNLWDSAWAKIKTVAKVFADWFMAEALPAIKAVLAEIGIALGLMWEIFGPIFEMIWDVVKVVFAGIAWYWMNVLWPVFAGIGKAAWWLLKEIFWPVFKAILTFFAAQMAAVKQVWDQVLKPVFTAIGDALKGPMTQAWETFCDFLGDTWQWIQKTFADSVNVVIGILNGLSKAFNSIMESLGSDLRISMIGDVQWGQTDMSDKPKSSGGGRDTSGGSFHSGGYTGPGSKYTPRGEVHADEFVLRKESTSKIRRSKLGLGWLDALNEDPDKALGGYASGGLVGFGRKLQGMGYQVGQHPAFGRVGRHGKGSLHYSGNAIDVNADGRGQAYENMMLDRLVPLARAGGFGMKWRVADHFNHAHVDQGGSWKVGSERGPARGKPSSGGGGIDMPEWMSGPVDWFKDKFSGALDTLKGGSFNQALIEIFKKILGGAAGKIGDLFGGGNDDGAKEAQYAKGGLVGRNNGTKVFDDGGLLQPGWTQVFNGTTKPEPVFTAEQFAAGHGAKARGGPLVNIESMPVQGPNVTAGTVADEIMWTVERAAHGGKFAGVSN